MWDTLRDMVVRSGPQQWQGPITQGLVDGGEESGFYSTLGV